ncbi:hypothetical protein [Streptomyces hebeiensis]
MTMDALALVLAALATARITRLITADRLTKAPRTAVVVWTTNRAIRRGRDESLLAYLVTCSWCASVYVGAVMGAAWWAWGEQRWFAAGAAALAFSYIAGWLAAREAGE